MFFVIVILIFFFLSFLFTCYFQVLECCFISIMIYSILFFIYFFDQILWLLPFVNEPCNWLHFETHPTLEWPRFFAFQFGVPVTSSSRVMTYRSVTTRASRVGFTYFTYNTFPYSPVSPLTPLSFAIPSKTRVQSSPVPTPGWCFFLDWTHVLLRAPSILPPPVPSSLLRPSHSALYTHAPLRLECRASPIVLWCLLLSRDLGLKPGWFKGGNEARSGWPDLYPESSIIIVSHLLIPAPPRPKFGEGFTFAFGCVRCLVLREKHFARWLSTFFQVCLNIWSVHFKREVRQPEDNVKTRRWHLGV